MLTFVTALGRFSHEWMVQFLQHRIGDRRVLRPDQEVAEGRRTRRGGMVETEKGTPQGSAISPLLANVYLHYVFDLWVQHGGAPGAQEKLLWSLC